MFVDKRKYKRVEFDCEIVYPVVVNGFERKIYKEDYYLHAVDISESGICLESSFEIPMDNFISFYLRIEDNLPFRCLVKIVWSRKEGDHYIYGGEFVALGLQEIQIIRKFVESHKQK
jgi:hypothetical protein